MIAWSLAFLEIIRELRGSRLEDNIDRAMRAENRRHHRAFENERTHLVAVARGEACPVCESKPS